VFLSADILKKNCGRVLHQIKSTKAFKEIRCHQQFTTDLGWSFL